MKTLLIPVDFTPTTDHAVHFSADWTRTYGYDRVILLKSFYDSMFDAFAVSGEYMHVGQHYRTDERQEAEQRLHDLCQELAARTGPGIKIMTAISEAPLVRAVMELIQQENVDMVLLGSDHREYSSQSFVAGNVITIAKVSPVRVLIVPVDYAYKAVERVLVPCNFNALQSLEKMNSLRAVPQWLNAEFLALFVDPKERYLQKDEAFKKGEDKLHHYLEHFRHQIYFSNEKNIIDGILHFTENNLVQLIIAMPGQHSFLYSLTRRSISQAIYRNAKEPVLILK